MLAFICIFYGSFNKPCFCCGRRQLTHGVIGNALVLNAKVIGSNPVRSKLFLFNFANFLLFKILRQLTAIKQECFIFRRVHITNATLQQLGDRFEVEPGDGISRESYLSDHKIETYLIIPPKVSDFAKLSNLPH